ncbi:hypothetical protein E2K80_11265 [Rhodophyticola sp. CCM32]|uniref:hypothetical protein n=1 Tax=Rhodophyticola sp. CCM32 TaxID=2916397 RepID=UPI00107F942F|nr:hypothetical protein [Rhodophyticola sp. CCM32]QBY01232.1 hypothetical protein E2K80_11265 [Rhodophyticola sp. CCM32]
MKNRRSPTAFADAADRIAPCIRTSNCENGLPTVSPEMAARVFLRAKALKANTVRGAEAALPRRHRTIAQ